jgi:hypothetical protein
MGPSAPFHQHIDLAHLHYRCTQAIQPPTLPQADMSSISSASKEGAMSMALPSLVQQ